jgi:iron-sulfur cluster assembly protein
MEHAASDRVNEAEPKPATEKKTASISVSAKAVDAIARQMKKRGGSMDTSLRVGIRGGGCSGFKYVSEFHDGSPHTRDRVYEYVATDGTNVRVVVDPKSLIYLNGSELEWVHSLMFQGFKFVNPQEKTACGCGHSFTV